MSVTSTPKPTITKKRRTAKSSSRPTQVDAFRILGFTVDALRRYEALRASGCVNMLDSAVQRLARITEDEHNAIICCSIYNELVARFVRDVDGDRRAIRNPHPNSGAPRLTAAKSNKQ